MQPAFVTSYPGRGIVGTRTESPRLGGGGYVKAQEHGLPIAKADPATAFS